MNPKLGDKREAGNELETGLGGGEFGGQGEQEDEIQGRGEKRNGASFSSNHHKDGRNQRNEDQKKKRADGAHLESRM
jgi:hypothetical protein